MTPKEMAQDQARITKPKRPGKVRRTPQLVGKQIKSVEPQCHSTTIAYIRMRFTDGTFVDIRADSIFDCDGNYLRNADGETL